MFKNIGLILSVMFLGACSRYSETVVETVRCETKFHSSIQQGALEATQTLQTTYEVEVNIFQNTISRSVENISAIESCSVKKCKEGFVEYNNKNFKTTPIFGLNTLSYDKLCVAPINSCQETLAKDIPQFLALLGLNQFPLSSFIEVVNKTTPECSEEETPFSCAEGYLVNNTDPQNPSCSVAQVSCLEDELTLGASAGIKQFDTETNNYGSCQMTSCLENYTLNEGSCESIITPPEEVLGCMDSRAANYNPLATQEDLSCMCDGGVIYTPITGCDEEPFTP